MSTRNTFKEHRNGGSRKSMSRDILFQSLKRVGVEKIEAHFDGSGDSGSIDEVTYDPDILDEKLKDIVVSQFYDILEEKYGGWEIDDGSFGDVKIDLTGKKIKCHIDFTRNYRSTIDESDDVDLG